MESSTAQTSLPPPGVHDPLWWALRLGLLRLDQDPKMSKVCFHPSKRGFEGHLHPTGGSYRDARDNTIIRWGSDPFTVLARMSVSWFGWDA